MAVYPGLVKGPILYSTLSHLILSCSGVTEEARVNGTEKVVWKASLGREHLIKMTRRHLYYWSEN